MAHELSYQGITTWICSNGRDLEIYDPTTFQDKKAAHAWVASEVGQQYEIHWKIHGVKTQVLTLIFLDGGKEWLDRVLTEPDDDFFSAGINTSSDEYRPYTFAVVKTTDVDLSTPDQVCIKKPGRIEVLFFRVRGGDQCDEDEWTPPDLTKGLPVVGEEEKRRGAEHVTQFGAPQLVEGGLGPVKYKPYSKRDDSPWAVFVFDYRPASVLEAASIKPKDANAAGCQDEGIEVEESAGSSQGQGLERERHSPEIIIKEEEHIIKEHAQNDTIEAEVEELEAEAALLEAKAEAREARVAALEARLKANKAAARLKKAKSESSQASQLRSHRRAASRSVRPNVEVIDLSDL